VRADRLDHLVANIPEVVYQVTTDESIGSYDERLHVPEGAGRR
jgi:hypothetical protein